MVFVFGGVVSGLALPINESIFGDRCCSGTLVFWGELIFICIVVARMAACSRA
jgi:hypothetical protein